MEKSIQFVTVVLALVALNGSTPKMAPQTPSGRHLSFFKETQKTEPITDWAKHNIQYFERLEKPKREVIVAVIDTGIDLTHPYLKNQLWQNPGESGFDENGKPKQTNGVDDDRNGFIDDYNGWNFAGNNHKLSDFHGHGTHISGIIAAEGPHYRGVAPQARLMVLKYYDPKTTGLNNLKATIDAINYAVKMGAHIINYSSGGGIKNISELKAVEAAYKKGVLLVAAAGNESSDADSHPYYPASYEFPNVLSVTAINPNNQILSTSNYGNLAVDAAAPGENILSTLPGGVFGTMTGTSQATAFASALAAQLYSHSLGQPSASQLAQRVSHTGLYFKTHNTRHKTRISMERASQMGSRAKYNFEFQEKLKGLAKTRSPSQTNY